MIQAIGNNSYPQRNQAYTSFGCESKLKSFKSNLKEFRYHRYKRHEPISRSDKILTAVGSLAGTFGVLMLFAKKQKVNPLNLKYGLKEMLALGTAGALSGTVVGIIADEKNHHEAKIHEGVFQALNACLPVLIVAPLIKLCESTKGINNNYAKIAATLLGVGGGMVAAEKLANAINDPHDRLPDRKLCMKDALANIDEAFGALVLAKFPIVDKLHLDKLLPLIYSWGGYRAGTAN